MYCSKVCLACWVFQWRMVIGDLRYRPKLYLPWVVVHCPSTPAFSMYHWRTLSRSASVNSCGHPLATVWFATSLCWCEKSVSWTCWAKMSTSLMSVLSVSVCLYMCCKFCCRSMICCCISWTYGGSCVLSMFCCILLSVYCATAICSASCLFRSVASLDAVAGFLAVCGVCACNVRSSTVACCCFHRGSLLLPSWLFPFLVFFGVVGFVGARLCWEKLSLRLVFLLCFISFIVSLGFGLSAHWWWGGIFILSLLHLSLCIHRWGVCLAHLAPVQGRLVSTMGL